MKKFVLSKRVVSAVVLSFLFISMLSARDWFVKSGASTSSAGDSWENACNVSVITGTNPSGIADGDVVYLAAGTYLSSASKTIAKYISIYGGYAASSTGTDLTLRNLVADSTIFAPSVGGTSRCLSINATVAPTVAGQKIVLDGLNFKGFTMTTANSGVAITLTSAQSDVDFKNLNFINNVSLNAVGGAFVMASFVYNGIITFDGCTFTGNQANFTTGNGYGGAMYFNNGATAKTINIKNSTFKNNTAYGRGGAGYFTANMTVNISDCVFDSNYCTNAADNVTSGGCFYITSGTYSSTFNVTRSIFVNNSCTAKGSVFWFNTIPTNYLNLTNCSLIGNYAKRLTVARAAIDADQYATTPATTNNLTVTLNGCVLSNYNYSGGAKASNKADVMSITSTAASTSSTFTNSILNGVYFTSSNTFDAVSPSILYATTGYLKDSTIALALSGDLKITDKIVLNKTFKATENVGTYTHTQIFDVKRNTGKAMTLNATIRSGYMITVDGVDYKGAGLHSINIPASVSDPVITYAVDLTTGTNLAKESTIKINILNDNVTISGVQLGTKVGLYNASGQSLLNQVAKSDNLKLNNLHSGVYILTIGNERLKFVK